MDHKLDGFCDRLRRDKITHLAVVGSRAFADDKELARRGQELVNTHLDYIVAHTVVSTIVTGGARGIDTFAEDFAKRHDGLCDPIVEIADWKNEGRSAGAIRNEKVAEDSQAMLAFLYGPSPGTRDALNHARRRGFPTFVVEVHS